MIDDERDAAQPRDRCAARSPRLADALLGLLRTRARARRRRVRRGARALQAAARAAARGARLPAVRAVLRRRSWVIVYFWDTHRLARDRRRLVVFAGAGAALLAVARDSARNAPRRRRSPARSPSSRRTAPRSPARSAATARRRRHERASQTSPSARRGSSRNPTCSACRRCWRGTTCAAPSRRRPPASAASASCVRSRPR